MLHLFSYDTIGLLFRNSFIRAESLAVDFLLHRDHLQSFNQWIRFRFLKAFLSFYLLLPILFKRLYDSDKLWSQRVWEDYLLPFRDFEFECIIVIQLFRSQHLAHNFLVSAPLGPLKSRTVETLSILQCNIYYIKIYS